MVGIYSHVTINDFVDGFHKAGRGDQFSRSALRELYYYYNCLSEDLGEPVVFDPIAICCDWAESTKEDIILDYDLCESVDLLKYLQENTQYFILGNGIILYQQF